MRNVGAAIVTVASAAALVPASSAAPSGDTCTVSGGGTKYTVLISLPPNAPEQGGFAFGVDGAAITKLSIAGTAGGGGGSAPAGFTTQNLPPKTSAGWNLNGPAAVPGASITASLTTSAAATGSFTVVPANAQRTAYYDPIACQFPKGTPTPSNKFTVQRAFTYDAAGSAWHFAVVVPGPGALNVSQRKVRPSDTTALMVRTSRVSVSRAGMVALALKPTAAGKAALAKSGSIKLNLTIEFSPKNGKPANRLLAVTLKT
jgi:hypothetical protein